MSDDLQARAGALAKDLPLGQWCLEADIRTIHKHIRAAVEAEREACAQVGSLWGADCANAIRARSDDLREHEWVPPDDLIRWEYCRVCLVMRRADGKNKPCKGPAAIRARKP